MGRFDNLKVESFCCFISLQTGVKIIGFLWQFVGLLALFPDEFPLTRIASDIFSDYLFVPTRGTNIIPESFFYDCLVVAINVAIGTVLLVGVFNRKPPLLKAFCIVVLVMVTLELIFHIQNDIFRRHTNLLVYFGCLWDLYSIVVVKSAYYEMKGLVEQSDQDDQGGQVITAYDDNTQMHQAKPLDP